MPLDPETAKLLGQLIEQVRGLGDRMDRAYGEYTRQIADQQAQAHEIKHDMRGQAQTMLILGERLAVHVVSDEKNNLATLEAIRENRQASVSTARDTQEKITEQLREHREGTARELADYREVLAADITEIKDTQKDTSKNLQDLMTWRGKVLGGLAVAGLVLGVIGHFLWEGASLAWTYISGHH